MSLETLLAAANFVEANDRPDHSACDTQLSIFATKRGQLPSVRDVKEYRYTEDSKDQGVCHGASGNTRQVHNKLEKNRRAVLKDSFEGLRKQIPSSEDQRSSHLDVLRMAVKYVQTLKLKSKELERSRARLQQQNSSLQRQLVTLQLSDSSVALPTSPSTDTADDSPFVSDDNDEQNANSGTPSRPQGIGLETHDGDCTAASLAGSNIQSCENVTAVLAARSTGSEMAQFGETASVLTGTHVDFHQSSPAVSRSATIAELTGSRRPVSSTAGHRSALSRIRSSTSNSHSMDAVNGDIRTSAPRHSRTVVQMLQDSLLQKAQSQEVALSNNGSNFSQVAVGQTRCADTSAAAAVEVLSPAHVSPSVLMPTTAAGGFMLTVEGQHTADVGQLMLPLAAQSQCVAASTPSSSSTSSQQLSSIMSPTVGQLVLCPAVPSQIPYQPAPLTIATTSSLNSASQFCTLLGPMTSVPLLPVSALVQSVQVMPAAVGVPINPVFVTGNVPGTSSLFMVPN